LLTVFSVTALLLYCRGYSFWDPKLPEPRVDIEVPDESEMPLVHIVNTRFMQEQGNLPTLAMARFHLFRSFCFPTMVGQTSQHFFWIIKTDPQMVGTRVFQLMVELLQDYSNIYLVASNRNFLIQMGHQGCWRDGKEPLDLLRSSIFTGNITRLHQAMALREERPVLETRLDADDGLHLYYIQYVQAVAMMRFNPIEVDEVPPDWLYWCARRHVEWHSSIETNTRKGASIARQKNMSAGIINPVEHSKLCITPGITVGYNVGVAGTKVPIHSHQELYDALHKSRRCYPKGTPHIHDQPPCLDLINDLLFCALRSRTWTSAGMQNVPLDSRYLPKNNVRDKLWQLLDERFHINQTMAQEVQTFLLEHRKQIALENLLGQCTSGHSCKKQAEKDLKKYLEAQA